MIKVRESDKESLSTRQAILAGLALGIGADLIAHAMSTSHIEGVLVAFMAYGLAIAIDTVEAD